MGSDEIRFGKNVSGAVVRLFSWSASGPEQRLQTEPGRLLGAPRLRTERLTSLHAAKNRFLFRAERPVDPRRPIVRSFDRPRCQGRSLRPVLGPTSRQASPLPLLRALDQVRPQRVPLDVAAHCQKMLVRLHRERLIPALIQVAGDGRPVMGTPALGVGHGQPAHEGGDVAVLAGPHIA